MSDPAGETTTHQRAMIGERDSHDLVPLEMIHSHRGNMVVRKIQACMAEVLIQEATAGEEVHESQVKASAQGGEFERWIRDESLHSYTRGDVDHAGKVLYIKDGRCWMANFASVVTGSDLSYLQNSNCVTTIPDAAELTRYKAAVSPKT